MVSKVGRAAILIAGPTASGKSALAIRLAQRLGGTIINADSMQVYRDLRILTARPSKVDEDAASHVMYGSVDGAARYSVSAWLADAAAALDAAREARSIPIFVGGTGLYFKALTQGLSAIPTVPDIVRDEIRAWAATRAPQELHETLRERDPATAARLRSTDPQRLIRALEVHAATGKGLSTFQSQRTPPHVIDDTSVAINLTIDRDVLRDRIERRFDEMVEGGAIDEVATLMSRSLDPAMPIMRAHGVPPFISHLRGELSLEAAILEGKMATRRYFKRQDTFVRNQLTQFHPIDIAGADAFVMDQFV